MERMKAVVCDRYGLPDVLRVMEIDQPRTAVGRRDQL